ncbi:hypothetical protein AOLI_G00289350 [Acnodon oligacanthus]
MIALPLLLFSSAYNILHARPSHKLPLGNKADFTTQDPPVPFFQTNTTSERCGHADGLRIPDESQFPHRTLQGRHAYVLHILAVKVTPTRGDEADEPAEHHRGTFPKCVLRAEDRDTERGDHLQFKERGEDRLQELAGRAVSRWLLSQLEDKSDAVQQTRRQMFERPCHHN